MVDETKYFQLFLDERCILLADKIDGKWQLDYGKIKEGKSVEGTVYLRNMGGLMEDLNVSLILPKDASINGEIISATSKQSFGVGHVFPITIRWTAPDSARAKQYVGQLSVTATLLEEVYL